MGHVSTLPLSFAMELLVKAAEERQTQAAWELYVAMVPWMQKQVSFAEFLDRTRARRGRDVRRVQMTPEEIERNFDRIVELHLAKKAR